MRRFILVCFCLLSFHLVFAQESKVRITSLVLTHENTGWRVDFPGGANSKYSLQNGDLLTEIDAKNAGKMGPLAVTAAFNASFDRSVPLTVRRSGEQLQINLWRSDGPAPALKPEPKQSYVSISETAPDFTLPTLSNVPTRLSAQRGKWVLISFWATWCGPCQQEAEILNRLAKIYPQHLTVLALAVKDSREKLNAFSAKVHPAYTILDAGPLTGQPALSYGVGNLTGGGSVPVNVLVRPDGKIAYVQGGYEAPSPLEQQVTAFITAK
jgi:cytochrome c biogenesis protein CcmG/thiol:disulfide interchange protein DsbE